MRTAHQAPDTTSPAPSTRAWTKRLLAVAVALTAVNLRPAITSLGALLEEVRDGIGMSGGVAGVLTSVPPLCFALVGVTAPRLARRFGAPAVVCAGLLALTAGLLLRPYLGGVPGFLAASALALMGIAVGNVLMPVIVKTHFPDRVGPMTGLYSMGLALGTATAAAVTVPLTHALGEGWRAGLAVWAGLAGAAVVPWVVFGWGRRRGRGEPEVPGGVRRAGGTGRVQGSAARAGSGAADGGEAGRGFGGAGELSASGGARGDGGAGSTGEAGVRARARVKDAGRAGDVVRAQAPLRITRSRTAWALAVFFGLQATGAYVTMGWMAQIFRDAGVSAGTAGLLLAVTMVLGVPLAFVIPRLATRLPHQGPIVVALGVCGLAGYAGLYAAPASGAWAWAVLLGIANCAFPLALTMVGMRARTGAGVAQLSAFAQSTGYLISIPGPLLMGVLYQSTGNWHLPLTLMSLLLVPQTAVGILAGRNRTVEDELTPTENPAPTNSR
ncbi:MFS transporter [Streptomyces roseirectus]|uniref:MFS transporter n=1 Tax=Streptomyces roseirectus TaxID=2768066 RepID=A0A7H0IT91_9ACTN|nr:MFS transporter [Streptomyces roseirectus]